MEPSIKQAADAIIAECDTIGQMLLEKNLKYGNSALEPMRVFSKLDAIAALRVRIDDKISRLLRGDPGDEDTILDLIGYLILLRIAEKRAMAGVAEEAPGVAAEETEKD